MFDEILCKIFANKTETFSAVAQKWSKFLTSAYRLMPRTCCAADIKGRSGHR
jgi:hypothetical protein